MGEPARLIASEAAGWIDGGDLVEVQLDDGLEGLAGGAVAGGLGQGVEPGGVFGLQGEELGYGGAPALGAATPTLGQRGLGSDGDLWKRPALASGNGMTSAIARLALGARRRSSLVDPRACVLWTWRSFLFRHVTELAGDCAGVSSWSGAGLINPERRFSRIR